MYLFIAACFLVIVSIFYNMWIISRIRECLEDIKNEIKFLKEDFFKKNLDN